MPLRASRRTMLPIWSWMRAWRSGAMLNSARARVWASILNYERSSSPDPRGSTGLRSRRARCVWRTRVEDENRARPASRVANGGAVSRLARAGAARDRPVDPAFPGPRGTRLGRMVIRRRHRALLGQPLRARADGRQEFRRSCPNRRDCLSSGLARRRVGGRERLRLIDLRAAFLHHLRPLRSFSLNMLGEVFRRATRDVRALRRELLLRVRRRQPFRNFAVDFDDDPARRARGCENAEP